MSEIYVVLLGILPAGIFMWIGNLVHAKTTDGETRKRWLLFLLGGLSLSLVVLIVAGSISIDPTGLSSVMMIAMTPTMISLIAALILFFISNRNIWSWKSPTAIPLFVFAVLMLVRLAMSNGREYLVPMVLGAVLTALAWQAWGRIKNQYLILFALEALLLGFCIWAVDTHQSTQMTPAWLNLIISLGVYLLVPGAGVIISALLLRESLVRDEPVNWRKLILHVLSAMVILLLIGCQIFMESIWEVATDGLGALMLWMMASIVAVSSAILMAWSMPRKWIWVAVLFALTVPVVMQEARNLGTYDSNGEWGTTPVTMTDQRAEKIDRAIQKYYERNNEYPQNLSELAPRYILYIPNPYIIPGQDWCYEGGKDYYRFGYVYRQYFSTAASAKVYSSAGEPPDQYWECQREAGKYPMPGF